MGFFKPGWYIDILGTLFQAFSTLSAFISTLVLIDAEGAVITEFANTGIAVHDRVVIYLEYSRDVHATGTGHAVPAAGALIGPQAAEGVLSFAQEIGPEAVTEVVEG